MEKDRERPVYKERENKGKQKEEVQKIGEVEAIKEAAVGEEGVSKDNEEAVVGVQTKRNTKPQKAGKEAHQDSAVVKNIVEHQGEVSH